MINQIQTFRTSDLKFSETGPFCIQSTQKIQWVFGRVSLQFRFCLSGCLDGLIRGLPRGKNASNTWNQLHFSNVGTSALSFANFCPGDASSSWKVFVFPLLPSWWYRGRNRHWLKYKYFVYAILSASTKGGELFSVQPQNSAEAKISGICELIKFALKNLA